MEIVTCPQSWTLHFDCFIMGGCSYDIKHNRIICVKKYFCLCFTMFHIYYHWDLQNGACMVHQPMDRVLAEVPWADCPAMSFVFVYWQLNIRNTNQLSWAINYIYHININNNQPAFIFQYQYSNINFLISIF